ncbi:hypothetical protein [Gilvibacter sediminis]|uniref:hypothetical protein n=1 Tax=Gilvibacter sediminis TaxID=379071 RepID=UPI002350C499|nr:hypothetical protein [Gilvibacter sediminis]MDC7998950.1 hypothetical protein [Gilvibacter sediminis]
MEIEIKTLLNFWEKRRVIFTVAIAVVLCFGWLMRGDVPNGIGPESPWIPALIWLIGANVFYCLGWGFELLFVYYLRSSRTAKRVYFTEDSRNVMFWLGLVFSLIWTWFNVPYIYQAFLP